MKKQYAEITLDGAGYCYLDGDYSGLFTRWIETCIVFIVKFNDRFLLIHDTSQLDIKSLTELVNSCGDVTDIAVIHGSKFIPKMHEKRIVSFAKSISFDESDIIFVSSEMDKFNLIIDVDGGFEFLEQDYFPALLSKRKNIDLLHDIINFNNYFNDVNAQSIPVDVQFNGKCYLDSTKPIHTIDHAIETILAQPDYFDINVRIIHPLMKQGVLSAPQWFHDLVNSHMRDSWMR